MSAANAAFLEEDASLEMTPMIDMAFLILIFFMCLPFKTLEGKLQAFLPTEKGLNPIPQDPDESYMIKVHIAGRALENRLWGFTMQNGQKTGGITVKAPSKVVYKFGDQETQDLKAIRTYVIAQNKAALGSGFVKEKIKGEIKAGHRVPHKFVIAVLNKFTEAGIEKVDFYGTQIPPDRLRKEELLPYPNKDYNTQGG